MVNTVGSLESKYWNKKMRSFKKRMRLTPLQRSFIIGSMLGDATMRIGKNAKNANFKIDHCLEQKEYVFWKYKILKNFVTTPPKVSYRKTKEGVRYKKSWWFRTIRHPILTDIYNKFYTTESYRCGTKIVPDFLLDSMNSFIMAVWIMDDGSYNKKKIDISTYSFTLQEIKGLCKIIKNKFGIKFRYHNDRNKGYRMYCNITETKKLVDLICLYIIKSMRYKIGLL
ncbi:MAG: hypothetical protein ABH971_00755 [bacterium]